MSNLKDVKIQKVKIILNEEEHFLILDFNAIALLEEKFGSMEEAFAQLENGKLSILRFLIWAMLSHEYMNEDTGEMDITIFKVGKWLSLHNMDTLTGLINNATENGLPEEYIDNDKKNALNTSKEIDTEGKLKATVD